MCTDSIVHSDYIGHSTMSITHVFFFLPEFHQH